MTETEFIDKLVAVRRQRGLTVAEVARRMHVSPPAVTFFERRYRSPTLYTILRYADAVGATFDVIECQERHAARR